MNSVVVKRALISVSNKQGIVSFAQQLHALGIEILSTGGTRKALQEAQIPVIDVSEITGFPEMMDGRVKTLHPKIHGAILGVRATHAEVAKTHNIDWIDLVVVNLYPFAETIQDANASFSEAIENIDIGGPSMIRSAAKNMNDVAVIVDPADYDGVIQQLNNDRSISLEQRKKLAIKAFKYTADYDALIHRYLSSSSDDSQTAFPEKIHLSLTKTHELRYGENPNQSACAYQLGEKLEGIFSALQHQGKTLSYNNFVDADAATACVKSFEMPTAVIVKHANPCGVASASSSVDAFQKALDSDSTSAFGGIVSLNKICDAATAVLITRHFFEVLIAPSFSEEALVILSKKPNLRVLELPCIIQSNPMEYKGIEGGMLIQFISKPEQESMAMEVVTELKPSQVLIDQLLFSWHVVKQVKSNAIVIASDFQTKGIGAGQVSRIDAVDIAVRKAGEAFNQAVLASDAFFPFRDSIDRIANTGIAAIIQPGGSMRDQEVIDACNQHGISMVFTGTRCFKH